MAKRARGVKKLELEEVGVEERITEQETVKNGASKKKANAKSTKPVKEAPAPEPDNVELPAGDKKKPGRKPKTATIPVEADPLDIPAPPAEEAAKSRKGRKPAVVDNSEVVEEPAAKKGRGRKPAANDDVAEKETAPVATKKGKAPVENGNSSPAKPAAVGRPKGKGKAAKEVEPEPEVQSDPVAAPVKRGRGKPKADTKEPEASPAKKAKIATKEPSKKASPKKLATAESNAQEEPAAPPKVAAGRGRKKATPVEEKPVSPAKSPAAVPAKRGRGRKAAEPEANGQVENSSGKSSRSVPLNDVVPEEVPVNGVTHRKKKANEPVAAEDEPKAKKAKAEKKPAAPKVNKSSTDYGKLDFNLEGKDFNFKISSWNVAGLRGWIEKGGLEYFEHEQPDILCIQETKCAEEQLPEAARTIKGYLPYWLCMPGGYAGVAIYSKKMPINVTYGLGDEEQDVDGRLLTAEYEKFYLVCAYVPNAGRKLVTLPKRMRWDEKFHQYLKDLDAKKPVVLCGDLNVAHEEIDLANPKTNKKNAGFTQEERDGMSKLLSLGFVDTFRRLYPDTKSAYTFWTYMGNARAKNVGWRLDYFITSERFQSKVVDNVMRSGVYGSDHCPITLFLKL